MPITIKISDTVRVLIYSKDEIDQMLFEKADKVDNAIEGNLVNLTAPDGNIADSGINADDLILGGTIDGGVF